MFSQLKQDLHRYFRYVAKEFVALQCEKGAWGPTVNLHGDAHLEQYLITSLGRGLGDFDEATVGPVSIDLSRIATSIGIASGQHGWNANALWGEFVRGYSTAVRDASFRAPIPEYVRRTKAGFLEDRADLVRRSLRLMGHLPRDERMALEGAVRRLDWRGWNTEPNEDFPFSIEALGHHQLGTASRRSRNYLVLLQVGDIAEEKLVIEFKQVTTNHRASCLPLSGPPNAKRIQHAQERIAYHPFRYSDTVSIGNQPYWVHEWVDDYYELDLNDDRLSQEQLEEMVFDMGVQLGLGHPKQGRHTARRRLELDEFIQRDAERIWRVSRDYEREVHRSWKRLRRIDPRQLGVHAAAE